MTQTPQAFKKGYRFPIYPTVAQQILFEQTFGCCRYVYNRALAEAKQTYEHYIALQNIDPYNPISKPDVSGYAFINKLPKYKADPLCQWLNEAIAVSLQQSLLHLGHAFSTFFRQKKGYPQFKKKTSHQSFSLMKTAFRFKEDDQFYIAKSKEPLKIQWTQRLPAYPSSCTISRTPTGQYYISFICEYQPTPTSGIGQIGIDLGLTDLVTLSTGEKIANPKHYLKAQQRLKRIQQAMSRKQKGSRNRNKARLAVAKQHAIIANQRQNFHHQLSRRLVNENQVIGLEKLMVQNMMKNRKLSKHIADAAWKSLTTKLEYKARESQHCNLVYMDTWYPSSHLCHVTGQLLERKLGLAERSWDCPYCGQTHDRDVNAALNMQQEAVRTLECLLPEMPRGQIVLANSYH